MEPGEPNPRSRLLNNAAAGVRFVRSQLGLRTFVLLSTSVLFAPVILLLIDHSASAALIAPRTPARAIPGSSQQAEITPAGAPTEEWYLIQFDEDPVGYERIRTQHIDAATRQHRVIRRRETRLTLVRFGKNLSVSADLETTETPDGTLLSWSLSRTAGDGFKYGTQWCLERRPTPL